MKKRLVDTFKKIYRTSEEPRVYFAPGRVNLIGEHTDYNGGHVFPCAITMGTYIAILPNNTNKCRFYSVNFSKLGIIERHMSETVKKGRCFTNYPFGIVWTFKNKGYIIENGFDMVMYSTLPNASGLSSSASIEVAMAYAMNDLLKLGIDNKELALLCQYSENNFNQVQCGIMDQFAIAMGKENHAIFLDTNTLEYKYVPLDLEGIKIVISCSNKKRGLQDSKYNERHSECEKALERLNVMRKASSLGEFTLEEYEEYSFLIQSSVLRRRARHAITENQRTIEAVRVLEAGDMEAFGKLMIESHRSLRSDYEVTGKELDTLFNAALKQPGVLGSRMTGAGFGGCSVSLVKENAVDTFIENVGKIYKEKIGYEASFFIETAAGGPRIL